MKNKQQEMNRINRAYNTPFTIQAKEVKQDEDGLESEEWVKKYKLFGFVKNLHGAEYELAKQVDNSKTIKIIIKYGPNINENMRIIFNKKVYDIDNIDNINYLNEELEIKAIERVLENEES